MKRSEKHILKFAGLKDGNHVLVLKLIIGFFIILILMILISQALKLILILKKKQLF